MDDRDSGLAFAQHDKNSRFAHMKCYNCNKMGHYASHCDKLDQRIQEGVKALLNHKVNSFDDEDGDDLEPMTDDDLKN